MKHDNKKINHKKHNKENICFKCAREDCFNRCLINLSDVGVRLCYNYIPVLGLENKGE